MTQPLQGIALLDYLRGLLCRIAVLSCAAAHYIMLHFGFNLIASLLWGYCITGLLARPLVSSYCAVP
jgi:hypothetical protein